MTVETKTLFEPSDIIAVQFECEDCHASNVILIGKGAATLFVQEKVMGSCPHCHTPFGIQPNSQEHKTLFMFVSSLEVIAANMNGRKLKLKVEIRSGNAKESK